MLTLLLAHWHWLYVITVGAGVTYKNVRQKSPTERRTWADRINGARQAAGESFLLNLDLRYYWRHRGDDPPDIDLRDRCSARTFATPARLADDDDSFRSRSGGRARPM